MSATDASAVGSRGCAFAMGVAIAGTGWLATVIWLFGWIGVPRMFLPVGLIAIVLATASVVRWPDDLGRAALVMWVTSVTGLFVTTIESQGGAGAAAIMATVNGTVGFLMWAATAVVIARARLLAGPLLDKPDPRRTRPR